MRKSKTISSEKKPFNIERIISIIAITLTAIFGVTQCIQNNRLSEQISPELDVNYSFESKNDDLFIKIENIGIVDCEKVWLQEKIYVLIDSLIYEGFDIPHFNYIVYKNSKEKLFELKKGENHEIKLDSLQFVAFQMLHERFNAKIISCWKLMYNSKKSNKKYSSEKYFVHEYMNLNPTLLIQETGGYNILQKIEDYIRFGIPRGIKIFPLTRNFELNTPNEYIITKSGDVKNIDNKKYLTLDELKDTHIICGTLDVQMSSDLRGTFQKSWDYNKDKKEWTIYLIGTGERNFYTRPFKSRVGYLREDEYRKVIENKEKYSYIFESPLIIGDVNLDSIMGKAKENFISSQQY